MSIYHVDFNSRWIICDLPVPWSLSQIDVPELTSKGHEAKLVLLLAQVSS